MIKIALEKGKILRYSFTLLIYFTRSSLSVHITKYRIRLIKCYNMRIF